MDDDTPDIVGFTALHERRQGLFR